MVVVVVIVEVQWLLLSAVAVAAVVGLALVDVPSNVRPSGYKVD